MHTARYWLQTLGCPKNQVDSEKLAGALSGDGYVAAETVEDADLVVVNTCAFINDARQESIDTVLELSGRRRPGARLVVTGCMAERYGDELAAAMPEVDTVAAFGVPLAPRVPGSSSVAIGRRRPAGGFDLLELPRPAASAPWAYVKIAEGCDRTCGFCAIPSFRGSQRSRDRSSILAETDALVAGEPGAADATGTGGVQEIVLVAQDLASYGRDRGSHGGRRAGSTDRADQGAAPIVDLVAQVRARVPWTRLLYLYPSQLTDRLVDEVLATGVPYFDLSLQHVSRRLLRAMRRWGDGERFLDRIASIRRTEPVATFRSSFILGYPGETEEDHQALLEFIEEAQLDWAGFFPYSSEAGTLAAGLPDQVPVELALERLRECAETQDAITAARRDAMVGRVLSVLVDRSGEGRSVHEAPEIDGIVRVPSHLPVGAFATVEVTAALGPDLDAVPVAATPGWGQNASMPAGDSGP